MDYSEKDAKTAFAIFFHLLKNHELPYKKNLYDDFQDNENVRQLITDYAEIAEVQIVDFRKALYIIPNENNTFLGFSQSSLKQNICPPNATNEDFALAIFALAVLVEEFYSDNGQDQMRHRLYIPFAEFISLIEKRLEEQKTLAENQLKLTGETNLQLYITLWQKFSALQSSESVQDRKKNTKEGFLYKGLAFYESQNLIYRPNDKSDIYPTDRLDLIMNNIILNQHNHEHVKRILTGEGI